MAVLPVRLLPDPVLRRQATPVEAVDGSVRQLLDDMLETMYNAPGIGLAGPQVGISKRVIVMDCSDDDERPNPIRMVNPEITERSEEIATQEEGCLSVPGYHGDVARPVEVKVRYIDENGKKREMTADGLLATCIQHEVDHLDGVLFIDYLSRVRRDMIIRKLTKEARLDARDNG